MIVEHTYVRREGRVNAQQLGIYNDALVPGLRRLADTIHTRGSAIGIQITHGGGKATADLIGRPPISASDVLVPGATEPSQAASERETS